MGIETLVALTYALFLFALAWVFEQVGRATHQRSEQYRLKGFTYREEIDAFECSEGALLPRVEPDRGHRLVVYQAPEQRCGGCPVKHFCTEHDRGRQVVRSSVPWIETEVARFHHGLSLTLLVLAAVVLAGVVLLYDQRPADCVLLGGCLTLIAGRGSWLLRHLKDSRLAPGRPRRHAAVPRGPLDDR